MPTTTVDLAVQLPVTYVGTDAGPDLYGPALGGVVGTGDLTVDDGDTNSITMYAGSRFANASPGIDTFIYTLDALPTLGSGMVIRGATMHFIGRAVMNTQGYFVMNDGSRVPQESDDFTTWPPVGSYNVHVEPGQHYANPSWVVRWSGGSNGLFTSQSDYVTDFAHTQYDRALNGTTALEHFLNGEMVVEVTAYNAFGDSSLQGGQAYITKAWVTLDIAWGSTPRTTPPRRLWPRDDGLTGGAPRLSGSKSAQGSNRLSGGYV